MPTVLQERVFNRFLETKKQHKAVPIGRLMIEEGAGKEYARKPFEITTSKGWQELLARYDDEPVMEAIYRDALDKKDKRNATANRDIYLKLKDRYPAQKSKVLGLFGGLDELEEKDI